MEKFNGLVRNRYVQAALAGGLALTLLGCGNTSASGEGDEFIVRGQVTDPGERSLKAEIYQIDETNDAANDWFELGNEHQIHDNCDCDGTWMKRKQFGTVYDTSGKAIEPADVAIGSCVIFEGSIRKNQEGKYTDDRPVYVTAQVVPCPADVY